MKKFVKLGGKNCKIKVIDLSYEQCCISFAEAFSKQGI